VARQRDLLERLAQARGALLGGHRGRVGLEDLGELRPDAQRRVQRRPRVLRDVGHGAAPELAQVALAERRQVAAVDADRPAVDGAAAAHVAEQRHPDGRLARPRLAHEPEHLARVDLERDLVDHVDVGPGQRDAQALDVDGRRTLGGLGGAHDLPPRSRPMAARATPSVTRFVPTVSRPMASTGRNTDHGWTVIARRFSLIIRPQSAEGGCRPKPRKLTPATIPIEYVMRSPISTSSGLVTFGRSSPKTMRQRFSPTTSADLMKSRSTTSCPAPRMTRATRGAWVRPTVRTRSHSFGPIAETTSRMKMIAGNDSRTSLPRMSTSSSQLRL